MKKVTIILSIVVVIILSIFLLDNAGETNNNAIKVGFSGPLSGPVAWAGELYLEGILAAQKDINGRGGVQGKPIEVIVEDNHFTGKGGVNSFNTLKSKGAEIVLSFGTVPTVPMSPLSKESGIPLLTSGVFTDLTADNLFAMHMSVLPEGDVDATVKDMEMQEDYKIGVLYMNNEYGVATLEAFKARIQDSKVAIIKEEAFLPETPDFSASILKLVTSDIDAIYLIDLSFIRPMSELKIELGARGKDINVYLPASAYSSDNVIKHPDLFEGVHVVVSPVSVEGTKERGNFLEKLNLESDSNLALTHQATGYDNLDVIARILNNNPNTEDFPDMFSSFGSFGGAVGEYRLDSRYIGIPLVPAIFTERVLKTVELES